MAISGAVGVLIFDEAGGLLERRRLSPGGADRGVEMPSGIWHTFVALSPGSVFFETKAGPYEPLSEEELAAWAPAEGAPEARELESAWRDLF